MPACPSTCMERWGAGTAVMSCGYSTSGKGLPCSAAAFTGAAAPGPAEWVISNSKIAYRYLSLVSRPGNLDGYELAMPAPEPGPAKHGRVSGLFLGKSWNAGAGCQDCLTFFFCH